MQCYCPYNFKDKIIYTRWLISLQCALHAVYEDEDELLWSPDTLPENKVRSFLSEVLLRTTDEKTGCDKPGMHVRDNEQVSHLFRHVFIHQFFHVVTQWWAWYWQCIWAYAVCFIFFIEFNFTTSYCSWALKMIFPPLWYKWLISANTPVLTPSFFST